MNKIKNSVQIYIMDKEQEKIIQKNWISYGQNQMSIFVYVSIKVNAMVNIKPLHAVTKGNTGLFLITLNYFLYIQNDKSISIILTFLVVWGGGFLASDWYYQWNVIKVAAYCILGVNVFKL